MLLDVTQSEPSMAQPQSWNFHLQSLEFISDLFISLILELFHLGTDGPDVKTGTRGLTSAAHILLAFL